MTGGPAPEYAGGFRRLAVVLAAAVTIAGMAQAQSPNQFGGQDRANAASQLIVLGVQRALDSLPPTAAQPVTYEFDPASDAFRRTTRLGPTVLRSAQTMEEGSFGLRLATWYATLFVVAAIAILFSSFSTPLLSTMLTLACFFAGHLTESLLLLKGRIASETATAALTVLFYALPNLEMFNIRAQMVHNTPLPSFFIGEATLYWALYLSTVLLLSIQIFQKKDFV